MSIDRYPKEKPTVIDNFYELPKDESYSKYVGKTVKCINGDEVKIKTIVPNIMKPTRFEINGTHQVVVLSLIKQLDNIGSDITEDDIKAFDDMECFVEQKGEKHGSQGHKEVRSNYRIIN